MIRWSKSNHGPISSYRIGTNVLGEPKIYVNCFVVDGLLIDTGPPRASSKITSILKNEKVDQIFITHFHEDHSGNVEKLKSFFDCSAFGFKPTAKSLSQPYRVSPAQWILWGQVQKAELEPIDLDQLITTNSYNLQLIHIPGHAHDMVGLYEEKMGWFFSADLYIHPFTKIFLRAESMATQISSIKKVLSLDFDVLICSHAGFVAEGPKMLREKLSFLESFYEEVAEAHHSGMKPSEIMRKMRLDKSTTTRILSLGALSAINMVKSVIRDQKVRP